MRTRSSPKPGMYSKAGRDGYTPSQALIARCLLCRARDHHSRPSQISSSTRNLCYFADVRCFFRFLRGPFGQARRNFMALNGPKYKPRGLQRLLDQHLESDPLLDRALTSVVIPAFDIKIQQPVFFSSWRVSQAVYLQPCPCYSSEMISLLRAP